MSNVILERIQNKEEEMRRDKNGRFAKAEGGQAQDQRRVLKVVCVTDTHAPEQDRPAMRCVREYIQFYQPDVIVHLGDVGDYSSVSWWMRNKRLALEGRRINNDIDHATKVLDQLSEGAPNARKVVLMGNHDNWVKNYIDNYPNLEGAFSVERTYAEHGWEVIPFNEPFRIGKLYMVHGYYTGDHHAKKTVTVFGSSVMYGHKHDWQVHSDVFVDGDKVGMSIGCLCNKDPEFQQGKPNRWIHGFATVDVDTRNGNFFIDFLKIVHGRTIRNGRVFGG
jgi:predicted phosphodiesterase